MNNFDGDNYLEANFLSQVDDIMGAMKTAFTEALQASANSTLCDTCPVQNLHKLCNNLEGVTTIAEKDKMVHETIKILSDYEQLHVLNEVNEEDPESDNERIEITINVLRKLFDDKQKIHKHSHKMQIQNSSNDSESKDRFSSSQNSTFFNKAKKSLTSSLQNFSIKKPSSNTNSKLPVNSHRGNESKIRSRSFESSADPPEFGQNNARLELNLENTVKTRRTSSIEEVEKKVPQLVREEKEDEFPVNAPIHELKKPLRRESSWRQAIYQSVVVPNSRRSSSTSIVAITGEPEERKKVPNIDVGALARSRWKNAIHNQILLIRMEKENKKLAANISATEIRRQKLSYQDLSSFTAKAAKAWDDLISLKNNNEQVDKEYLLKLIHGGVPRARRGEIWQYIIKQNQIRNPQSSINRQWEDVPYRTLLKKNSGHQHAILIDLGRTFPTHAHFVPTLGSGQIGLFNILTAYSELDEEVGYCQGLSFVAGIFLIHMPEEEAFKSFCHLMMELQIRTQYKPDMNAVQQELYQLSRLLHDYHPKVYDHFSKYDVTPTLYAAPWFLTLYASQYPIGFVSRVMDLVVLEGMEVIFKIALALIGKHANDILECETFESIVDYMKLDLPNQVIRQTDNIITRALSMEIKQQLNLYEAEYQLLNEEMTEIQQSKEKLDKQEEALKETRKELSDMKIELVETRLTADSLRESLNKATLMNQEYERKIEALAKENKALKIKFLSKEDGELVGDENWDLIPSPPSVGRELNGRRANSLDSFLSSEGNTSCEWDV